MQTYYSLIFSLVAVTYVQLISAAPRQSPGQEINYANNKDNTLCTTQDCVDVASEISGKLDRTVDPCDNFYQFACGRWVKSHPVNASYPSISSLSILRDKTTERLREILEDVPKLGDTLSLQKARKLYTMCMDDSERQYVGISAISELVRKNGGWPISMSVTDWQKKGYTTWQQISNMMNNDLFYNGLYSIAVEVDNKKSDSHVIEVLEPVFFVPRDIMIDIGQNPERKAIYRSLIEEVAYIFVNDRGAYVEKATLARDALDIVDFEIELAKLTMSLEDSRNIDKVYNEMTIEELQRAYDAQRPSSNSKINWLLTVRRLFTSVGITIQPSEKLVVQAYKFLTHLVTLLERTPSRTIVNYMQWTFIRSLLPYADDRLEKIHFEIEKQFKSKPPSDSRWKTCTRNANLETAISHEYVKKYVKQEDIENINDIITDNADIVRAQISASTWMDEATKKVSLDKLASMRKEVSIPDWYSNEAIDAYYDGLDITGEYLESMTNLFKYGAKRMLRKLRKPVDKQDWGIETTIVNAFYNPVGNVIVLTAGILQNPVYDRKRPAFMNYGGVGFVIGHEINHGFDNLGRKFDKNGNSIQWWTNKTIDRYEQLTQCFVDQYNGYKVPGLEHLDKPVFVNGRLSLGENIGDSAGIVATYNAYKKRKAKLNQSDIRLPGLEEYTNDQILFMNAAQTFCENDTPQKIKLMLLDEHPRAETRVRGSFSNFHEFSSAYNCPTGKEMNPEKKCILWQ